MASSVVTTPNRESGSSDALPVSIYTRDDSGNLTPGVEITGDVNVDSTSVNTGGGLVGKASGTNADFTTAYASATTITISGLPSYVAALTDEDIEVVRQIATTGAVTATYSRDDATMSITTGVLTVTGATFAASDTFVILTNVPRLQTTTDGYLKVDATLDAELPIPQAEFKSPTDFTATYTSSTTITLSALPITITDDSQIVYIKYIPTGGSLANYLVSGMNGVTITESSSVLTVNGAATPFASGDVYEVGINAQRKAYDSSNDLIKTQDQSPVWSRYTDQVALIGSAQELDATPTDLGSEIDMRGYNQLGLWLTVDIGTSTDVTIRLLHKHTSAGAEEYREIYLGSPSSNITTISLNDYQVASDADQLFKFNIPVSATSPYIQIQVSDAADGDGQIDAAYVTKAYAA